MHSCISLYVQKRTYSKTELSDYISKLDNSKSITDKKLMIRSLIILSIVIIGFVLSDAMHMQAYIISLFGASVLLLFEPPKEIIHEVEWLTIFFFIGLFIIIGGLEATGGIHFLAQKLLELTQGNIKLTAMVILWGSGFLSAIIDNIPYTITMTPLIQELHTTMNIYPYGGLCHLGHVLEEMPQLLAPRQMLSFQKHLMKQDTLFHFYSL